MSVIVLLTTDTANSSSSRARWKPLSPNKAVQPSAQSTVLLRAFVFCSHWLTANVPLVTATIVSREKHKHVRRCNLVDSDADSRLATAIHFERAFGKSSVATNTNIFVKVTWSIATQTVDWRQRFASNERLASRGLHYHAST